MPDAGALPRHRTSKWHYTARDSWDRERIVAAMREWAQEVGAPPRSWEWCPGQARSAGLIGAEEHKWEREHPRWPGNTTVGDRPGRPPTKSEWETVETGRHPSSPTVRRAFGTFTAGIRPAGLEPVRTAWSRERIIEAARGFERERGRAPRGADWSRATPDSPSAATVYNHFGHWDEMLRAAREPD